MTCQHPQYRKPFRARSPIIPSLCATALCLLSALASPLLAQDTPTEAVAPRYDIPSVDSLADRPAMELLQRLIALASSFPTRLGDSTTSYRSSIQASAESLRDRWRWNSPNPAKDPIEFRQGVAYAILILTAGKSDTSKAHHLWVLREVADDIAEKAEHCRQSSSGMASNVTVRVRTWNGTTESSHLQVSFLPKLMEAAIAPPVLVFRKESSPAVTELAPGKYVFWASETSGSHKIGQRTTVRVGRGQASMEQDIPAP
jgi:hypothetical protein